MRNGRKLFTVTIFHTPIPGFQYEAHIYLGDKQLYVAGGMTEAEAEQAARAWIRNHYATQPYKGTKVRTFTVYVETAPAMT